MNLPEKIDKLFKTKEEDNIKLAKNIITQKTDSQNVIAFICILKKHRQFETCKEYSIIESVNKVLKEKISNQISADTINYTIANVFRWAITNFKSIDNINYAYEMYTMYINTLKAKAIDEITLQTKLKGSIIESDEDGPNPPIHKEDLPF